MALTTEKAAIASTLETLGLKFVAYIDAGGEPRHLVEYLDQWMRGLDPRLAQGVKLRRHVTGPGTL